MVRNNKSIGDYLKDYAVEIDLENVKENHKRRSDGLPIPQVSEEQLKERELKEEKEKEERRRRREDQIKSTQMIQAELMS